jgi:flavin-binding protein dodecin
MSVAKITEIKSSSKVSFDDAIKSGLKRASQTLDNICSAWISSQEVLVDDSGDVSEYRVLMKITCVLKD